MARDETEHKRGGVIMEQHNVTTGAVTTSNQDAVTDVIFHIRKPLKKQRGNQFYYDYSDRWQGNYCGAPETSFDIPYKSEARSWSSLQTHYEPCRECCRIRAATQTDLV